MEALREALGRRVNVSLPSIEWHEALASTSDRLKALARAGAPEWTAVLADEQTGGRGREGRSWASPRGGLYLSVLLRPRFEALSLLPLAAGVAVAEVAGEWGVAAELKWPNDVLVRGRKLAGILAEAASGTAGVEWIVLGIGVNVADVATLGEDLRPAAASLAGERGALPALEDVAAALLERLLVWYDALGSRPFSVVDAWRVRAVPWWGARVEVRTAEGPLRGRLHGIDETGALLLDVDGGERRRLLSGDVSRVRPAQRSAEG